MSATGQQRTYALQQTEQLFDHLVGPLLHEPRYVEAERLGGLQIDDQFELGCRLDRKFARFHALEDTISINGHTPELLDEIRTLRDQPTEFSE
jgi:hypothetical protein